MLSAGGGEVGGANFTGSPSPRLQPKPKKITAAKNAIKKIRCFIIGWRRLKAIHKRPWGPALKILRKPPQDRSLLHGQDGGRFPK